MPPHGSHRQCCRRTRSSNSSQRGAPSREARVPSQSPLLARAMQRCAPKTKPRARWLPRHVAFVLSLLPATAAFRATNSGARRTAPPPRTTRPRATAFSGDDAEPPPRQSSPFAETDPAEERKGAWLTPAELRRTAEQRRVPFARQAALHADVAYYGPDAASKEAEDSTGKLVPTLYRIKSRAECGVPPSEGGGAAPSRTPVQAQEAAARTLRWCTKFVETLELCPWARLSRQGRNAIRMKILHNSLGPAAVERVAREGARELLELTTAGDVDANAGITFVVVLPQGHGDNHDFEFEFAAFYDFCTDLEERLFDEADAARERGTDAADRATGDAITLAPFHPAWHFASPGGDAVANPLDYEKRAPYPTISLVRTSAIEQAGAAATHRIGQHNEEVLSAYGARRLEQLYAERVLRTGNTAP